MHGRAVLFICFPGSLAQLCTLGSINERRKKAQHGHHQPIFDREAEARGPKSLIIVVVVVLVIVIVIVGIF